VGVAPAAAIFAAGLVPELAVADGGVTGFDTMVACGARAFAVGVTAFGVTALDITAFSGATGVEPAVFKGSGLRGESVGRRVVAIGSSWVSCPELASSRLGAQAQIAARPKLPLCRAPGMLTNTAAESSVATTLPTDNYSRGG
jgi:hypothetical protein